MASNSSSRGIWCPLLVPAGTALILNIHTCRKMVSHMHKNVFFKAPCFFPFFSFSFFFILGPDSLALTKTLASGLLTNVWWFAARQSREVPLLAEETSVGHLFWKQDQQCLDDQGRERESSFLTVNDSKKNLHPNARWSWHVVKRKTHLEAK